MVELVKSPEFNDVDLSVAIPNNAKIVECMCYLFSLCVTLYIDTAKKVRKSASVNAGRLEYISAQIDSVPPVCQCTQHNSFLYLMFMGLKCTTVYAQLVPNKEPDIV